MRDEKSPQKTKLLQKIERRLINVPKEEFLLKKDVTLEEKRVLLVYTKLNIIAFLIQAIIILILVVFKGTKILNLQENPLKVTIEILYVEVGVIGLLEVFFIILPLPVFKCFGSRQHINNILMLKIKWFFMLQCLLQTIATLSYTTWGEIPYI